MKDGISSAGSAGSSDWMASAVKSPGSFRASAQRAGQSTTSFAREKSTAPGLLGKRARLALTFSKFRPKASGPRKGA